MKKNNKIIALCLSFALLLAAVGGTIAWLTDKDQVENVFSVGSVDIQLTENLKVENKNGADVSENKINKDSTTGKTTFSGLMPGDSITKQPVVKNMGTNEAWVRVVVEVENKGNLVYIMDQAIDQVFEEKIGKDTEDYDKFYNAIFDGWKISYLKTEETGNRMRFVMNQRNDSQVQAIDSIRVMADDTPSTWQFATNNTFKSEAEKNNLHDGIGYFAPEYNMDSYYSGIMSAGDSKLIYVFYLKLAANESYTLFDGFKVPEEFDNQSMAFFDGLTVTVSADAIQTEGFSDLETAMTTLNSQHSLAELVAGK